MLRALTAAALGVYAGAMLTEALVLVPHWRTLPPGEFLAWYAANDRRLFGFFGTVTIVTALLVIATAAVSLRRQDRVRRLDAVAAVLTIVAVLMFPVYFSRVNASFAAGTIQAGDVPAELARWATWHGVRTALACVALAASMGTLRRGR